MSGGVESERDRELGSRRSALGLMGAASWVKTGWLDDWVGVVGAVKSPEALFDLEKILMLPVVELDEERKIPLKLRRRGDFGEEL